MLRCARTSGADHHILLVNIVAVIRSSRQQGEKDGRSLFMVVGIIAVPKGQEYLGEHQYTVMSFNNLQWTLLPGAIDRTQEARGLRAGGLLRAPIWRM